MGQMNNTKSILNHSETPLQEKERKILFRQIQTSHTHGVPKTHINTLNLSLEQGPQPLSKKKKTALRKKKRKVDAEGPGKNLRVAPL